MKTKLEMAHEYAIALINSDSEMQFDKFIRLCWDYADAMQAEADKRIKAKAEKDAERSRVFFGKLTKNEDGSCKHFHTTLNRGECFDCGEKLNMADSPQLEWQPDWSQAPDSLVKYFAVDENGRGGWFISKPTLCSDHWYWSDFEERVDNDHYDHAPSFSYTGDWRESLRKRPQ